MRIRLRTIYAGPHGTFDANSVADLPKSDAYDLIERGFAVQEGAEDPPDPPPEDPASAGAETAELLAGETAESLPGRRRRPK